MKSKDLVVGGEYAVKRYKFGRAEHVLVVAEGLWITAYKGGGFVPKGTEYKHRYADEGVLVEYLDHTGALTGRLDVVLPAKIVSTWGDYLVAEAAAKEAREATERRAAEAHDRKVALKGRAEAALVAAGITAEFSETHYTYKPTVVLTEALVDLIESLVKTEVAA